MIFHASAAVILALLAVVFALREWRALDKAREDRKYKEYQLQSFKPYRRYSRHDRLQHGRLRYEMKMLRKHWRIRLALDGLLVLMILSLGVALISALMPFRW